MALQVHQLFEKESSTYTYILFDTETKEAAIIDSVLETMERDYKWLQELDAKLKYILDTHVHADHITSAAKLRELTGAKTAISSHAGVACVDVPLKDGMELQVGAYKIEVMETPGHTDGCMSYYVDGKVFTGDALLIHGCGRTDFQQGSPERLYDSIMNKLYKLPDETILYPGHDYRGFTSSTIGLEKKYNARIRHDTKLESFVKTMKELKLADPKKIHEAVPANLLCGWPQSKYVLTPQVVDGIPEVSVHQVHEHMKDVTLIDVRTPQEFNNEYGHIPGAKLVTLGPELVDYLQKEDKEKEIVFICRSGGRSGQATAMALQMGFKHVVNMTGGMITWNLQQLPVERN
jgi:glyoxylase-like metal-dependent hydrolase (beta-lactamase superfamily II)/rhodanese-related sulfurtransferase